MKFWIATVSALAMAATPALAQGNGNGNGNGNRDRGAQNDNRGNGNANRGNRGGDRQEARGNRGNGNANRANRGNRQEARGNQGNRGNGNANRGNRGNGNDVVRGNGNRGNGNGNANRGNGNRGNDRNWDRRDNERYGDRDWDRRGDRDDRRDRDYRDWDRDRDGGFFDRVVRNNTGLIDGCPPGLAKKNPPCVPPGQARQRGDWDRYDTRYSRYSPNWWGLNYDRGNYFYEDGFLMRYNGDRVSGYIPLLGGALSIGNRWPSNYGYQSMPRYYSDYYGFGDNYRYADNVVYRLDPETAAIQSIAALLTGNDFTVGQRMPSGYDVYNVPYSYRDRYYDSPNSMYRYNNGYVYEIDPTTMLVASAIELIL